MADSTYSSALTKGIFVHKPEKKQRTPSKTISEMRVADISHQQYERISNNMKEKIKEIERNANQETFCSLVKFAKECHLTNLTCIQEVPSAILVMGVNMPDHSNIFSLLEEQLNAKGIFATVKLQSKECNSFHHLMQKLVSNVITKYQEEMGIEDIPAKKGTCTLSKLLAFYDKLPGNTSVVDHAEVRRSPRKSPIKTKKVIPPISLKSKPIVVLIQDVEAFNVQVLNELINNCSLYVNKLPLVLVFGMASAMVTLHNILPQKALSCLAIETFYSLTAIEYLTKILHQIVLSPDNPFKLGSRAFRLIVDTVLYHDFSIANLTNMLEFCLVEHFYENNVTVLCCPPEQISENIKLLNSDQLEEIKNLPSFSRFVENNPDCGSIRKKELKVLLKDLLVKQHIHYRNTITLLNCLHILTKDLPGLPLGKYLRELYPFMFEENLISSIPLQQAFQLLKLTSKDELELKFEKCLDVLNDATQTSELLAIRQSFLENLKKLQSLTEGDCEEQPVPINTEKVTSRAQLQERLRQQLKLKRSKFDQDREETVEFLKSLFENLQSPLNLPLHEVLYFDNALAMKKHLMAIPRTALHRDLVDPSIRLKCSCCKINSSQEISTSMPDVCVMYKLHLESGKLINLYDWLQAFKSVKEEEYIDVEDSRKEKETDMNIRFMHGVSELQHLGFIKGTKRKTDHVARLTFSSF